MVQDKEFEDNYTFFSEIRTLNEVGISPLMELEERFKVLRFSRSARELGIFPRSLLPEKSMWVRFKFMCFRMLPVKLASEMVIDLSFFKLPMMMKGLEALIWKDWKGRLDPFSLEGMLETVSLVRFWKQAS
ncbi:hypothetical protein C1H46_006982 [Malus baccata]|uniref:Uncharacterized protein n=1 Tax=Malus baccata TaxID=106549 RepID=A0A540N8J3_MALBA|nr:hypothetical protein C1H46_006982 [Malus baccata]